MRTINLYFQSKYDLVGIIRNKFHFVQEFVDVKHQRITHKIKDNPSGIVQFLSNLLAFTIR